MMEQVTIHIRNAAQNEKKKTPQKQQAPAQQATRSKVSQKEKFPNGLKLREYEIIEDAYRERVLKC